MSLKIERTMIKRRSKRRKKWQICSIEDCSKFGNRLVKSLKSNHKIKSDNTGRICELHYRRDLRGYKRVIDENALLFKGIRKIHKFKKQDNESFHKFCEKILKINTTLD